MDGERGDRGSFVIHSTAGLPPDFIAEEDNVFSEGQLMPNRRIVIDEQARTFNLVVLNPEILMPGSTIVARMSTVWLYELKENDQYTGFESIRREVAGHLLSTPPAPIITQMMTVNAIRSSAPEEALERATNGKVYEARIDGFSSIEEYDVRKLKFTFTDSVQARELLQAVTLYDRDNTGYEAYVGVGHLELVNGGGVKLVAETSGYMALNRNTTRQLVIRTNTLGVPRNVVVQLTLVEAETVGRFSGEVVYHNFAAEGQKYVAR